MIRTASETIALSLLNRNGIAAIWELEEVAAEAHRTGRNTAAAMIAEIADAAEREWFRVVTPPNGRADAHFHSSARRVSMSARITEEQIAGSPVIFPGYQASSLTATRQQLAIQALSRFVIFAFVAALVMEALG